MDNSQKISNNQIMKNVFCLIVIFALALPVAANADEDFVLHGGVEYDVNSARKELMSEAYGSVAPKLLSAHIYDRGGGERAVFSDLTYAVIYDDDPLHAWYYAGDGVLLYVEQKNSTNYPYKSYKYDTAGNHVNMSLRVSKEETFIYSPAGKLIARWLGANGYDEHGRVIMTRIRN
jgi:hypothetical protein